MLAAALLLIAPQRSSAADATADSLIAVPRAEYRALVGIAESLPVIVESDSLRWSIRLDAAEERARRAEEQVAKLGAWYRDPAILVPAAVLVTVYATLRVVDVAVD